MERYEERSDDEIDPQCIRHSLLWDNGRSRQCVLMRSEAAAERAVLVAPVGSADDVVIVLLAFYLTRPKGGEYVTSPM